MKRSVPLPCEGGAATGIRTRNLPLTMRLLCQLSYEGLFILELLAPYITVSSRDMQPRCLGRGRPHKEERAGAHCSAGEMIKTCHAGWRRHPDSNRKPADPKSAVLPLNYAATRARLSGLSSVAHFRFATACRCRGRSSAPSVPTVMQVKPPLDWLQQSQLLRVA